MFRTKTEAQEEEQARLAVLAIGQESHPDAYTMLKPETPNTPCWLIVPPATPLNREGAFYGVDWRDLLDDMNRLLGRK